MEEKEEKKPVKRIAIRVRKNAAKKPDRPKHRAFIPIDETLADKEPDFLSPKRQKPIKKEIKKKMFTRAVPVEMFRKRLGNALVLYPLIKKFLNDFEAPPNLILTFFNIKYLRKPTLKEICRTENISSKTAWRSTVALIEMGLIAKFSNYEPTVKRHIVTYSATLKGLKQMRSLELKMVNILKSIDLSKLDDWSNVEDK